MGGWIIGCQEERKERREKGRTVGWIKEGMDKQRNEGTDVSREGETGGKIWVDEWFDARK